MKRQPHLTDHLICESYVAGSSIPKIAELICRSQCYVDRRLQAHSIQKRRQGTVKIHGYCADEIKTPTYLSWIAMRQRCNNTQHHKYRLYGGRGIQVCDRWDSFENFLTDMGPRP